MKKQDIEDLILFQIDKTSKVSKQYSQREFDKVNFGITVEQWILLKIIQESVSISQKELADKSTRDPASITRTLDILEKKNFIIREQIPNNRRQYNIILTKAGASFVEKNMSIVQAHRTQSTKGMTKEELETLSRLLQKIQNNMS